MWVNGRNGALLRETSVAGYHTLWSLKTTDGSWDFGEYNAGRDWNNIPVLSYITDSDYNSGNNTSTYQIKFPLASGTVALTSDILNYYWANVKISTSSSTTTSPTVSNLTATNSIKMGNILLEHTDEINNVTNGSLYLNYRNSGNVTLCYGGGNVGIGTSPLYKLDVAGEMRSRGFHYAGCDSNDYILLAGGGYGRIFIMDTTRYSDNTSYELSFHKLSSIWNNLVWVDGCIWNSTSTSFYVSSDFYPYLYANSPSMRTIYRMDENNMITVDGNGLVVISCSSYPRRVGFFYTGRA